MGVSRYHVCHHCKDRTITCHINCELYKKEMEENEKMKEVKKQSEQYAGASREAMQWNHKALRGRSHKR